MESRSMNLLRSWSLYRTIFRCDLCGVTWVSPIVETTAEDIFEMNTGVSCPHCTACALHKDPSLRVPIVILEIQNLGNEFSLIAQFSSQHPVGLAMISSTNARELARCI